MTSRSRASANAAAAADSSAASTDQPRGRTLPRWHYLVALAAGAANTLSFAPTPHGGWLQLPVFVLFYAWLTRATGWKSAALTGGAFGFANFVSGIWWLYVSMHDYGGMPAPLAGAAVVLFSLYLALYPALSAGVWSFCAGHARNGASRDDQPNRPFSPTWHGAFAFASAWAIGEWLRGTVFTGFPWLASGYAQVDGPFAGFAPLVGVYGVGWMLALTAALIVQAWIAWRSARRISGAAAHERIRERAMSGNTGQSTARTTAETIAVSEAAVGEGQRENSRDGSRGDNREGSVESSGAGHPERSGASAEDAAPRGLARVVVPVVLALALIAAGLLLPLVQWTQPSNAPLTVRLLQGNVKQEMKFEAAGVRDAIAQYQQMITSKPADLIVTPETAIPVLAQRLPPDFAVALREFSDSTGSAILFGAIGGNITPEGRVVDYTNSLFGVTPKSPDVYRYDKHHLVPFGEFVPWGFRWFVNLMNIPLGDFFRGAPVQKPFLVHGQPVAVNICYEDIFGEEIARSIRENSTPAGVLVNSTNLAWFGDTIALDQHLQIARMRSLETGRPMLRATNTGMTAAIDAHGRVIGRLTPYTIGSLDVQVQGTTGNTPYVTSGNNTVLAVSVLLLAFGFAFGPGLARRRRGSRQGESR